MDRAVTALSDALAVALGPRACVEGSDALFTPALLVTLAPGFRPIAPPQATTAPGVLGRRRWRDWPGRPGLRLAFASSAALLLLISAGLAAAPLWLPLIDNPTLPGLPEALGRRPWVSLVLLPVWLIGCARKPGRVPIGCGAWIGSGSTGPPAASGGRAPHLAGAAPGALLILNATRSRGSPPGGTLPASAPPGTPTPCLHWSHQRSRLL